MKLLYDENLSPKLVLRLADLFSESTHVRDIGLARAADPAVWDHAAENDFVIISKDEDFHHLSFLRGAPPKVIGIQTGNASTGLIADLIRGRIAEINAFEKDAYAAFLVLP
jgi:predicted nuclease of predicted toxin-antitoxin system